MASEKKEKAELNDEQTQTMLHFIVNYSAPHAFEAPYPKFFYQNIAQSSAVLRKCHWKALMKKMRFLKIKYANSKKLREIAAFKAMLDDRKLQVKIMEACPYREELKEIFSNSTNYNAEIIDIEAVLRPTLPSHVQDSIKKDLKKKIVDLATNLNKFASEM